MGLGAGIVSGIGSALGGLIGGNASSQASSSQQNGAIMGMIAQMQAMQAAQNALGPYVSAGKDILPTLQDLMTPGKSAAALASMPGFKFQSDWGNLAATNALAAQGLGGSTGPLAKAISDYNNGLAGTYWQNTVGALQNFANMGAGAGSSLAGTMSNIANNFSGNAQNFGDAGAKGILGQANALTSGINGMGNAYLLSQLSPAGNSSGGNSLYSGVGDMFSSLGNGLSSAFSGIFG